MKRLFYHCPLGILEICQEGGHIVSCERTSRSGEDSPSLLLEEAVGQLDEYFLGLRKNFNLPLSLARGTPFQRKVWRALCAIPYGQTRTYGEIARSIGHSLAYRAVGGANNKNPIPVFIPCHRVVSHSPHCGGFGMGMAKKRFLLHLEQAHVL